MSSITETFSLKCLSGYSTRVLVRPSSSHTYIDTHAHLHKYVRMATHTNSHLSMIDWRFYLVIVYLPDAIDLTELEESVLIPSVIGTLP